MLILILTSKQFYGKCKMM